MNNDTPFAVLLAAQATANETYRKRLMLALRCYSRSKVHDQEEALAHWNRAKHQALVLHYRANRDALDAFNAAIDAIGG